MSLYGGIDLHANNSVIVFINERLSGNLIALLQPYQAAFLR
jgi:hypothetical protein